MLFLPDFRDIPHFVCLSRASSAFLDFLLESVGLDYIFFDLLLLFSFLWIVERHSLL